MAETDSGNRLTLGGPLTVAACEQLHADLLSALSRPGDVRIELDPVSETDLSLLQILIAAERSAAAAGKRIALIAPPQGEFARALQSCGFQPAPDATGLKDIFALS